MHCIHAAVEPTGFRNGQTLLAVITRQGIKLANNIILLEAQIVHCPIHLPFNLFPVTATLHKLVNIL